MKCLYALLLALVLPLAAAAQNVDKCKTVNGIIAMPNYVIPLNITNTAVVKDISVTRPFGVAVVGVFSYSNPGVGVCGYGVGADRCGTSIPQTDGGGAGYTFNPGVFALQPISGTDMVGLKIGGLVTNTLVGVGLCSL